MYANPFDVSCKLWKELDAVVTVTNTSLQNRSCCAQTFKYPFILPLPSLLRSAFDYPIHYAQPIITPSIIFSLQLPHPLYAAYNYPHPLYSAFNYPIHYIQPTITPFIMFSLQLPHLRDAVAPREERFLLEPQICHQPQQACCQSCGVFCQILCQ